MMILAEEWTSYVLSIGPPAVYALSSVCIVSGPAAAFDKAKEIGLTRWELPETNSSRSVFLKGAVYRAYHSPRVCRPSSSQSQASDVHIDRSHSPSNVSVTSTQHHRQTTTTTAAGPGGEPINRSITPPIHDPTDQAIHTLVNDHGFRIEDAKWALKITDTGEGINLDAALRLLVREREKEKLETKIERQQHASAQEQTHCRSRDQHVSQKGCRHQAVLPGSSLLLASVMKSDSRRSGGRSGSGWTWA